MPAHKKGWFIVFKINKKSLIYFQNDLIYEIENIWNQRRKSPNFEFFKISSFEQFILFIYLRDKFWKSKTDFAQLEKSDHDERTIILRKEKILRFKLELEFFRASANFEKLVWRIYYFVICLLTRFSSRKRVDFKITKLFSTFLRLRIFPKPV